MKKRLCQGFVHNNRHNMTHYISHRGENKENNNTKETIDE